MVEPKFKAGDIIEDDMWCRYTIKKVWLDLSLPVYQVQAVDRDLSWADYCQYVDAHHKLAHRPITIEF